MSKIKTNPSDFAAAYIQTLPHARKVDDFETKDEYWEYLDLRQEQYFNEFLRAATYANDELQKLRVDDSEEDK